MNIFSYRQRQYVDMQHIPAQVWELVSACDVEQIEPRLRVGGWVFPNHCTSLWANHRLSAAAVTKLVMYDG